MNFLRCIFLQFLLTVGFVNYYTKADLFSTAGGPDFQPSKWYPPLLFSTVMGAILSMAMHLLTWFSPLSASSLALWLSPLLLVGFSLLQFCIGSPVSLALAILAFGLAVIQGIYSFYVINRLGLTRRDSSTSMAPSRSRSVFLLVFSVARVAVYATFMASSLGVVSDVVAADSSKATFFLIILVSLIWTDQMIMVGPLFNFARDIYLHFALDLPLSLRTTNIRRNIWECSVVSPVLGAIHDLALVAYFLTGYNGFSRFAGRVVTYGSWCGLVYGGHFNAKFKPASSHTRGNLRDAGVDELMNSDLVASFCFHCGVTVGAICSLMAGSWTFLMHRPYATPVSAYAFAFGYFLCEIGTSWPVIRAAAFTLCFSSQSDGEMFVVDITIPHRIHD